MSEPCHSNTAGALRHDGEGGAVVSGIIRWLSLAAAPTFAMMALLAAVAGGGPQGSLCSATVLPLVGGMAPMYLLMSAFHSAPWLRLISERRDEISRN